MARTRTKRTRKFGDKVLHWIAEYHYKDDARRRARLIRNMGYQARVVRLPPEARPMRWAVYAERGVLPGFRTG